MTASLPVIEWVRRGQFVLAPSIGEQRETYMVFSRCSDLFHVYYCESCNVNLANQGQLEMHVEKGGSHRLVLWCSKRRMYEDAEPLTLQIGAAL